MLISAKVQTRPRQQQVSMGEPVYRNADGTLTTDYRKYEAMGCEPIGSVTQDAKNGDACLISVGDFDFRCHDIGEKVMNDYIGGFKAEPATRPSRTSTKTCLYCGQVWADNSMQYKINKCYGGCGGSLE